MQSEDYRLGTGHAKHVIDTTYKVGHRIVVLRNVDVAGAMFAVVYRCKALLLLAAAASGLFLRKITLFARFARWPVPRVRMYVTPPKQSRMCAPSASSVRAPLWYHTLLRRPLGQ